MKKKTNSWFRKPAAAVAVMAICLCCTLGAAAAGASGYFEDVFGRNGAVVGTRYEQATDEIAVNVVPGENEVFVEAVFRKPEAFPYRELETLGIDTYRIVDMEGNVVMEGEQTEMLPIVNGEVKFQIPLEDLPGGEYKLVVDAFVGDKKAEQPLPISGIWACEFTF